MKRFGNVISKLFDASALTIRSAASVDVISAGILKVFFAVNCVVTKPGLIIRNKTPCFFKGIYIASQKLIKAAFVAP